MDLYARGPPGLRCIYIDTGLGADAGSAAPAKDEVSWFWRCGLAPRRSFGPLRRDGQLWGPEDGT